MVKRDIGNIEKLRMAHGLTVDELMERLGKDSRNTYYYWLKTGNLPINAVITMHEIFGVSTDCILGLKPVQITE